MEVKKSSIKNVFLSRPAFICGIGDSGEPEKFVRNFSSGFRGGIKKIDCGVAGEGGAKSFFVGKIDDDRLPPCDDKFNLRTLRILNAVFPHIRPVVEKAVALYGKERVGVCIGSCDNGSSLSFQAHKSFFENGFFPGDYDLRIQGADYPACYTARKFALEGPCLAFSTACSSSASAIIKAKELIKSGLCDAVIAGGVDVTSDIVLLGFDSLGAVSGGMTNPFSKNRDGINLGEGAGVFLLSKDDLDETGIVLAGTGESSDASHPTAPLADGSGARQAMEAALRDGNLSPAEIDYVNFHGTGTNLNDSMEGKAVALVFDDYKVAASSSKPMTAHTLGASGSLELAICFHAIKSRKLPVHLWDGEQDSDIPVLNIVTPDNMEKLVAGREIRCCMSNSFAFGGCNVSLVIKKL